MIYKMQIDDEVRDATPAEIIKIKENEIQSQNELKTKEAHASLKAAAQTKLAALGLTVEDLTALGL